MGYGASLMIASRWRNQDFNARGPAKGDMYTMDESKPRSLCEELVWGKHGEPRMSPSDILLRDQAQEVKDEEYNRTNQMLASTMLAKGNAVGTSPAKSHGPLRCAPGKRVGEGSRGKGVWSELHIRIAAGSADEARHYVALFPDKLDAVDTTHDPQGYTVLHYAAMWDRCDVIELFINHGADPLAEDWEGTRPHEIARAKGHYAALKVLNKAIEHVQNNTVPPPSPLTAFKVKSNRSPGKQIDLDTAPSPVGFADSPKYAKLRALELGHDVDQDGDGVLDEHEKRQAGLMRGVLDQDGDGKVSQQEAEDFQELTAGLADWLTNQNLGYYFKSFTDAGLYTLEDLRHADLTEDDLEDDMGIASDRERMKVLQALARL